MMSIDDLKKLQARIIKKYKVMETIEVIVLLIIVICSIYRYNTTDVDMISFISSTLIFTAIILLITESLKYGIVSKDRKTFDRDFKNVFINNTLKSIFDDVTYKPGVGIKEETISSSGMFNVGDRYHSNDYVSAKYKSIFFEQSDIHIEEKHIKREPNGEKRVEWITIFKGRMMIFDFNKRFRAKMQVSSKKFEADQLLDKKKFSLVKLEDDEFNKLFYTYAENEHEAFYILTPQFLLKMKKILNDLDCDIMFYFDNSKLYVAINNNEDSFEYNVFKKINEEKLKNKVLKEIRLITDLVEELDLNNDLFCSDI